MAWMNTMATLSKGLEVASKALQACVCAGSSLKGTSMPWRRETSPPCANSVNKAWKKPAPSS
eukprot:589024-Amphidinium_carterae.1